MRDRSPVETVLTYATFVALSLAVHIVVILGNRPLDLGPDGVGQAPAGSMRSARSVCSPLTRPGPGRRGGARRARAGPR